MNKIDDGMIKGEDQLKKIESMISSMTLEEKQKRGSCGQPQEDKESLRGAVMKQKM